MNKKLRMERTLFLGNSAATTLTDLVPRIFLVDRNTQTEATVCRESYNVIMFRLAQWAFVNICYIFQILCIMAPLVSKL